MTPLTKKRWLLLALCALLLPSLTLAAYEENIHEGIFLVRPENQYLDEQTIPTYLSSEDLTFFACVEYEDTPIRLSVLCEDDNNFVDLTATKWGSEQCYIASTSLDELPCHDATLVADYEHDGENLRLTKEIRINRVTGALQTLLQTQFADGGWSSALDTAYALFSMKAFEDVFDDVVLAALNYLKDQRDETDKCWPAEDCQISTTAAITYLLNQAEYEDDLRIIHDATVYLEESMMYIDSGEEWTLRLEDFVANINNSVDTQCVYAFDEDNTTLNLTPYGTWTNISVTPAYGSVINVICTENIYADLYSSTRGWFIHYEGDNFTYTIPGPCWTYNNENVTCDLRATAFALGTPIDDDRYSAGIEWLANNLETGVTGATLPDDDVMNLALLLSVADSSGISTDERADILKHILYRQANKGAWNATANYYNGSFYEPLSTEVTNISHVLADNYTRSIVYTSFVVHALLKEGYSREDEIIDDAQRWVSVNEEQIMQELTDEEAALEEFVASYDLNATDILTDPKRNGMALYVLQQNTRPFIKSEPQVLILDKQNLTIDLVNPTAFTLEDLEYSLPSDLSPYISIEEKDYLAPNSFRRITLSQTTTGAVDAFGYLRITTGGDEYAKIPIIIQTAPSLSINFPTELTVFGTSTIAELAITKSAHPFSCTMQWLEAGISSPTPFTIEQTGTFNLPIQFTRAGTEEHDYPGLLTCKASTSTFTFPFTIRVNRFLTKPIAVAPAVITASDSETEMTFTVKNLLDESIDATVSLREDQEYISFSEYFLNLYPGETRNVTVYVQAPPGVNVSVVSAVIVKAFNIEERIPLQVEIVHEPESTTPPWLPIVIIVTTVAIVTALGYFAYANRKQLSAWYDKKFRKEDAAAKVRAKVEEYERKEEAIAIKNMIQILKMQGTKDADIRKRLVAEGFAEAEIDAALKLKTDDAKPAQPAQAPTEAPRK